MFRPLIEGVPERFWKPALMDSGATGSAQSSRLMTGVVWAPDSHLRSSFGGERAVASVVSIRRDPLAVGQDFIRRQGPDGGFVLKILGTDLVVRVVGDRVIRDQFGLRDPEQRDQPVIFWFGAAL